MEKFLLYRERFIGNKYREIFGIMFWILPKNNEFIGNYLYIEAEKPFFLFAFHSCSRYN